MYDGNDTGLPYVASEEGVWVHKTFQVRFSPIQTSQLLDIIGPTPHMTHFPLLKKISVVVEASIVAPYRETKTT